MNMKGDQIGDPIRTIEVEPLEVPEPIKAPEVPEPEPTPS